MSLGGPPYFMDANHALAAGSLLAVMSRGCDAVAEDMKIEPIYDSEGNYLNEWLFHSPFGEFVVSIQPFVQPQDALLALRDRLNGAVSGV